MGCCVRRRDERGAVLILVSLLSVVLVAVAAFAVDLGVQRVGRRDMQAIADLVALDMARQLDGLKTASQLTASVPWIDQLDDSVARNAGSVGDEPEVTAAAGRINAATGDFEVIGPDEIPSAVKVTAVSSVDFHFAPGRGGVARSAVATIDSNACFGVGSYAAALNTDKSALLFPLLRGVLGTNLDLMAVGYNGLASAQLSLLDLIEVSRLGVGTVDQLLDASLSLSDFYLVVADALRANGDTVNADLLQGTLATHIGRALNDVSIGELLNISQGNNAAVNTTVNVFNLVAGAAFLANGNAALGLSGLNLNLPLLGSIGGSLSVIQPPVHDCGPVGTSQHTEQVTVGPVTADLSNGLLSGITVPGLASLGITDPNPVRLSVSAASATGTLSSISCEPERITVDVSSQLASASLEIPLRIVAKVSVLGVLGLVDVVLPVTIRLSTTPTPVTRSAAFDMPPYEQVSSTGSGQTGLANVAASITLEPSWTATSLLGLNVKALARPIVEPIVNGALLSSLVTTVVTPVAQQVDNVIVGPLQRLLGLTVAGADVFADLPAPDCAVPRLKGR